MSVDKAFLEGGYATKSLQFGCLMVGEVKTTPTILCECKGLVTARQEDHHMLAS